MTQDELKSLAKEYLGKWVSFRSDKLKSDKELSTITFIKPTTKSKDGYWYSKDLGTEITDPHPVLKNRIKAGTCAKVSITIEEFVS